MFPWGHSWVQPRVASPRPGRRSALLMLLFGLVVVSCAGASQPTFNPNGRCGTDGRVPGAYPDLEANIPNTLGGRSPTRLDSGRNCTAANLGTFAGHGLSEVRFAG